MPYALCRMSYASEVEGALLSKIRTRACVYALCLMPYALCLMPYASEVEGALLSHARVLLFEGAFKTL